MDAVGSFLHGLWDAAQAPDPSPSFLRDLVIQAIATVIAVAGALFVAHRTFAQQIANDFEVRREQDEQRRAESIQQERIAVYRELMLALSEFTLNLESIAYLNQHPNRFFPLHREALDRIMMHLPPMPTDTAVAILRASFFVDRYNTTIAYGREVDQWGGVLEAEEPIRRASAGLNAFIMERFGDPFGEIVSAMREEADDAPPAPPSPGE